MPLARLPKIDDRLPSHCLHNRTFDTELRAATHTSEVLHHLARRDTGRVGDYARDLGDGHAGHPYLGFGFSQWCGGYVITSKFR